MKYIWLDCDPGHDDAVAILLALHLSNIHLLGISTVHGNASAENTNNNAARCLYAFSAPKTVKVFPGAAKPLLRTARHDPEIHGPDGLGGVEGLPPVSHDSVRARLQSAEGQTITAIEGIAAALRSTWRGGLGDKVTVVSSGPMTNIALFVSVYPELLNGIEEFVFMGGGVGTGNRGRAAEFNVLCDPEAAQIVLDVPIPKVMIPINVTHTAIVTHKQRCRLLAPIYSLVNNETLPEATTPLRRMLSTLIGFFASSYKSTFGFNDGPPLHDALTIAYVSDPSMFTFQRFRVDVELSGVHTLGETVVDKLNYSGSDDSWGVKGRNCMVAQAVNVEQFFDLFHSCVEQCDTVTPLNLPV